MTSIRTLLIALLLLSAAPQAYSQQQLAASEFDLANYQGKVLYVDFWASWCSPCRASFPFMAELSAELGSDLAIVAINVDENRDDADTFLQDYETPFDIVFDPTGQLATEFKVPGMPTSFLYDRDGQLVGSHVGFKNKDKENIRQWIGESINTQTNP